MSALTLIAFANLFVGVEPARANHAFVTAELAAAVNIDLGLEVDRPTIGNDAGGPPSLLRAVRFAAELPAAAYRALLVPRNPSIQSLRGLSFRSEQLSVAGEVSEEMAVKVSLGVDRHPVSYGLGPAVPLLGLTLERRFR